MISTRGQNTNDIVSNTTLEVEDVNYVLKKYCRFFFLLFEEVIIILIKHLVLHTGM